MVSACTRSLCNASQLIEKQKVTSIAIRMSAHLLFSEQIRRTVVLSEVPDYTERSVAAVRHQFLDKRKSSWFLVADGYAICCLLNHSNRIHLQAKFVRWSTVAWAWAVWIRAALCTTFTASCTAPHRSSKRWHMTCAWYVQCLEYSVLKYLRY